LARAFEDGTPFSLETKIITTTGRQLWAELHGLARIEEGAQTYIVGTLQDITERKQAEAKLNEQIAELRRWHELTLGREMRILGLKQEVNELLAQAGQPPRYASAHEQNGHP